MLAEQKTYAEIFRTDEQIFLFIEGHLKAWDGQKLKEIYQIDNTVSEGVFCVVLDSSLF